MSDSLLKLSAQDVDDLQVIAAVLQDAIAPVCDMLYRPAENKFIMVVHRFRWDGVKEVEGADPLCFERVHCALEVEGVEGVQQHGFGACSAGGMLDLLTVMLEEGCLKLVFAGGAQIRLKLGRWRLKIKDFGEPWPVAHQPSHPA
jgi:hypothetical protein